MNSLTTNVVILCWQKPTVFDKNAEKIANLLGANVRLVSVGTEDSSDSFKQLAFPNAALIVHAETLVRIADVLDDPADGLLEVLGRFANVFMYGFAANEAHAGVLRALSLGGLLRLQPLPTGDSVFRVSDRDRRTCGQFSGVSFSAFNRGSDSYFEEGSVRETQEVLVGVAGQPFCVRLILAKTQFFFVACGELADIDRDVASDAALLPWFSRLAPLMMFLRSALGDYIWHNERSQACFIIDDPLMTRRYGFLDFTKLLECMDRNRFATAIAFIPWNYQRSRKPVTDLFSNAAGSLSLCVHGCDHTGAEFASRDFDLLRSKACLALERMRAHAERSGVPFDDVMVFPQGLFSSEALMALEAAGYLAAVNTQVLPVETPQTLTLRQLLDVAITASGRVPLFERHYPQNPAEFAFDLFVGKPALVVEHHTCFRDGDRSVGEFMRRLNELDESLQWGNLGSACSQASLQRVTDVGDVHVRFYTRRFLLLNNGSQTRKYVLFPRHVTHGTVHFANVNDQPKALEEIDGCVTLSLSLAPGETADIVILPQLASEVSAWKPTVAHNAKVLARRVLCEFRDNYVDTHPPLAQLISRTRRVRSWEKAPRMSIPAANRVDG